MLRVFEAGAALLGEEVVLQVARVIGSSMARVADAIISAFIVNVAAPSLADDPGGLALARANTDGIVLLRQATGRDGRRSSADTSNACSGRCRRATSGRSSSRSGSRTWSGRPALAQQLSIRRARRPRWRSSTSSRRTSWSTAAVGW